MKRAGSRNGSSEQATFRRFNGSLLSITIGFTDERLPCTVCARPNAYDVLAARLADYSGCSSIQILPVFTADTSRQGASSVIHRERTIIGVAMVTERMGHPAGIAARLSIFLFSFFPNVSNVDTYLPISPRQIHPVFEFGYDPGTVKTCHLYALSDYLISLNPRADFTSISLVY